MTLEKKEKKKELEKRECAFCDGKSRLLCDDKCAAYAVMAIPRTRMVFDSVLKQYQVMADREPYHGPFCRRGNFPIGLNSDDITIVGPKAKEESNMDVR